MKKLSIIILLITNAGFAQSKYATDFDEFWTNINENYAYFDQQQIDWQKVREIYSPLAAKIESKDDFVKLLEEVLNELYNGHSSLNMNLNSSNRLIPSGSDLYIEKIGGKFIITDLRKGFGAEQSGLQIGKEVTRFNGKPIEPQLIKFLPKFTNDPNAEMYQYALSMLFAGTHDTPRQITTLQNGEEKTYLPDSFPQPHYESNLSYKTLGKSTGYIKINNSLWNNDLIGDFDNALDNLMESKCIVIDLTETANGGSTTVARSIMGRFINEKKPYQQHESDEKPFGTKRYWIEYVMPRKPQYKGKVIVLVGHWTGSMGEGIAIGFDGMKRAKIIGTKMAGLLGAISNFHTSKTDIGFQIPTERLYHVNGTPREKYVPSKLTKNSAETDAEMEKNVK